MSGQSKTSSRSKRISKKGNYAGIRHKNTARKKSTFHNARDQTISDESSGSSSASGQPQDILGRSDTEMNSNERMIGPITYSERRRKVLNYFNKKYNKAHMKKFIYSCRKQVAEKRLRIKGRFVTKEQAF